MLSQMALKLIRLFQDILVNKRTRAGKVAGRRKVFAKHESGEADSLGPI
jgi:hypothetical protein